MSRSRRVLLATDSQDPSGVGHHMLTLARGLAPAHEVALTFAAGPAAARFGALARDSGFEAHVLPDDPLELLKAWRPDVLHVHAGIGWEGQRLCTAGRAAGVTVVRTEHLPWLITNPRQQAEYTAAAGHVDAFIAVSAAALASWAPVIAAARPGAALRAIPNGVEAPPVRRDRAEVRAELGIPADALLLICVARFTPQKDHATLIAAAGDLAPRFPGLHLILAGEGETRAACEAMAAEFDHLRFLGQRADIGDLMAASDLLVLASRFEGLPLVVLEAMALGLPVVATRVAGALEALGEAHPFLAEPGDRGSLGAALDAALADPEARAASAAAQRERHGALFTAVRMARETAALYRAARDRHETVGRSSGMTKLRIGFIGAGGIAERHLGVLATFEDVTVAGIADPDLARAEALAARANARAFAGHEEMLGALDLDALWICVPPFAHGAPERAAIARGLPFLVEKPLSVDAATAIEIERAVREAGLVTAVGYHWRYLDTVDEARRLLADNPAHLMSGYWLDQTPPPRWWWQGNTSGGQIVEQATHIIDVMRFLAGDVDEVYGLAARRDRADFPGLDVATASTASLRFASGAIANLAATCALRWTHRVALHVFADGLALELTDRDLMVDVGQGRPVRGAEGDPVWRLDRAFLDAVKGGENRIRTPYAEAVRTHLTALTIARSVETGAAVRMEGSRSNPRPVFRPTLAPRADVA